MTWTAKIKSERKTYKVVSKSYKEALDGAMEVVKGNSLMDFQIKVTVNKK